MHLILNLTLNLCASLVAAAAPGRGLGPLFGHGPEVFSVRDQKGQTPSFRILDDTATERALAVAAISAINLQPEVQPKLPVTEYVNLKVQEIKISPVEGESKNLELSVKVSGRELPLPKKIDRARFLSGEVFDLDFPPSQRNVSFFDVSSSGKFRFKLNPRDNELQILDAVGRVKYSTPIGGDGDETLRFSGRGIRKL